MEYEIQLKLQAYLDGELSAREARKIEALLDKDEQAKLLLAEMTMTCTALKGFEQEVKCPDSREFFWSKIQRDIRVLNAPESEPAALPWWAGWRRLVIPAAIALGCFTFITGSLFFGGGDPSSQTATTMVAPGAFTYHDFSQGTTLVWLPYPAEN